MKCRDVAVSRSVSQACGTTWICFSSASDAICLATFRPPHREQEATIWGFRQLLAADLGFVQPDLSRCGGLSVAKQIAVLAEERQIQVVPHAWLTDLLTATSLHFNAWLEHAAYLEFNVSAGPLARDLFREPIALQPDGTLLVPTGPGIGVEPDPEAIERYRVRDD